MAVAGLCGADDPPLKERILLHCFYICLWHIWKQHILLHSQPQCTITISVPSNGTSQQCLHLTCKHACCRVCCMLRQQYFRRLVHIHKRPVHQRHAARQHSTTEQPELDIMNVRLSEQDAKVKHTLSPDTPLTAAYTYRQ